MRRWVVPLVVALVASGLAIAINLATEAKYNVWAWLAVVVFTVAGAAASVWLRNIDRSTSAPHRSTVDGREGMTHNEIKGVVHGTVIQGHDIVGGVTIHSDSPQFRPRQNPYQ